MLAYSHDPASTTSFSNPLPCPPFVYACDAVGLEVAYILIIAPLVARRLIQLPNVVLPAGLPAPITTVVVADADDALIFAFPATLRAAVDGVDDPILVTPEIIAVEDADNAPVAVKLPTTVDDAWEIRPVVTAVDDEVMGPVTERLPTTVDDAWDTMPLPNVPTAVETVNAPTTVDDA